MKDVKDILLGADGDVLIREGDLVIGSSTQQHQRLLLLLAPGGLKLHPTVGVDVYSYLLDDNKPDELTRVIQREYEKDGLKINKVNGNTAAELTIIANYK